VYCILKSEEAGEEAQRNAGRRKQRRREEKAHYNSARFFLLFLLAAWPSQLATTASRIPSALAFNGGMLKGLPGGWR